MPVSDVRLESELSAGTVGLGFVLSFDRREFMLQNQVAGSYGQEEMEYSHSQN